MKEKEKILQAFCLEHFGNKNVNDERVMSFIRPRGFSDLGAFLEAAHKDPEKLENVCFYGLRHNTHFLRDGSFWEEVSNRFIRKLDGVSKVRVLSLGCSTGLEPATMAIMLLRRLPLENLEIDAWDISEKVIEKARKPDIPCSPLDSIRERHPVLRKYTKLSTTRRFTLTAPVLERVHFHVGDIRVFSDRKGWWTGKEEHYDFILCRYVMMHLTPPDIDQLYQKIAQCLCPGKARGFYGRGESDPPPPPGLFRQVAPLLHQKNLTVQKI